MDNLKEAIPSDSVVSYTESGSIDSAELDPDLSKVADAAGQGDWVSTVEGLLQDSGDFVEVLR